VPGVTILRDVHEIITFSDKPKLFASSFNFIRFNSFLRLSNCICFPVLKFQPQYTETKQRKKKPYQWQAGSRVIARFLWGEFKVEHFGLTFEQFQHTKYAPEINIPDTSENNETHKPFGSLVSKASI
jgi:hypothetical protein